MDIKELRKKYNHVSGGTQTLFPKQVDELFHDIKKYFVPYRETNVIERDYLFTIDFVEIENWEHRKFYVGANSIDEALSIANTVIDKETEMILHIHTEENKILTSVFVNKI